MRRFVKPVGLNDIKVRKKLIFLYIFAVLIPVVLTNVVFYQTTSSNVKKQKVNDLTLSMDRIRTNVYKFIQTGMEVSQVIYTDPNLNDLLETKYSGDLAYFEAYDSYLRSALTKYLLVYTDLRDIVIYTNNPTIPPSGGYSYLQGSRTSQPWVGYAQENKLLLLHMMEASAGKMSKSLSMIRYLDFFKEQNEMDKILKIDYNIDHIAEIFKEEYSEGLLYLVDADGYIVAANKDFGTTGAMEQLGAFPPEELEQGFVITEEFTNVNYLNGWKVVGIFSGSVVLDEMLKSTKFILVLSTLNMIIPGIGILLISRSFHVRLTSAIKHIKKIKNQEFEPIQIKQGRDEIGLLIGELNRMTMKIKSLIQDVYESTLRQKSLELERTEAELNALQSQINPHVLFNTLEAIRMRSLIKRETETAEVIEYFAKSFRRALTWGNEFVSISDELQFVEEFLKVQQYRFGDKMRYSIEMDECSKNANIPKMVIQPFVENASIHGIEALSGIGHIYVGVKTVKDHLVISVTDTGKGLSEEKWKQISRLLATGGDGGKSVGIRNVYSRLKLYYGDRFAFQLTSREHAGTQVYLKIPVNVDHTSSSGG